MDNNSDIVIIGGGYAGLAAGIAAAREGAKVTLLERYDSIAKISRCGGGTVASEVNSYFDISDISHRISNVSFISSNNRSDHHIPEIDLCLLDTKAFLKKLESVALASGVKILCSHNVNGLIKKGRKIIGVNAGEKGMASEFRAAMTIDCSGVGRFILGKLGSRLTDNQKAFGIELEIDRQEDPDCGKLIIGDKDAPSGYAWIFPCPYGRTRIGVGFISSKYWRLADSYLKYVLETHTKNLKNFKIIERRGGFVPCHYPIRKIVYDGYALAGDSAGHISLIAGEGTRFALKWGDLVGRTSAKIISGKEEESIKELSVDWKSFRSSLIKQFYLNRIMKNFSDSQWDWAVSVVSKASNESMIKVLKGDISFKHIISKFKKLI